MCGLMSKTLRILAAQDIRLGHRSQFTSIGLPHKTRIMKNNCRLLDHLGQWIHWSLQKTAGLCIHDIQQSSKWFSCKFSTMNREFTEKESHSEEDVEELIDVQQLSDYADGDYVFPKDGHQVFLLQPDDRKTQCMAHLKMDEAHALVETLPNWTVVHKAVYPTRTPKKKTVFGKGNFGKVTQDLRDCRSVSAVFIGVDMLTNIQLKCLQETWGLPVHDRYSVVLQIFSIHARSKEAKLQAALAAIPYIRSRLKGSHDPVDQKSGGQHSFWGSGETLAARVRLLQDKEEKLKKVLSKVKTQRQLLRSNRVRKLIPAVAVVGYTNCGKTTLIKRVTGDVSMQPKDGLFATLDVTAHGTVLPNRMVAVFMDTVGFISDIPTGLIECFSATLEDVLNADIILHVRDISHQDTEAQKVHVLSTLQSLNLPAKLMATLVEVCNKSDKLPRDVLESLTETGALCVSAVNGTGIAKLLTLVQSRLVLNTDRQLKRFKVPMNGQHLSWLYREASVQKTEVCNDNTHLMVDTVISRAAYRKFKAKFLRTN